ncbi:CDP-alcohol phosphatidyltransferase family protein [Methylomicrobium sp. Wu6]|uniref:CDP-alcohol phosphatidyltransferase family protein n=1 Tax=Methylomicrobium sp. Wu6 TaxID=3107928 RepID=UPI002DD670CB|nr:CDP-alcohol phosphatidyltransferase family protein [Methylomicrobium sp. Wu6]MEC4747905.1 CDP-alcohol phosphatidyltransferase family protein [Methylomicrobium sp. Wu6]
MPSIYAVKPAFQNLLRPLVTKLARLGVTANQVTIAALILSSTTGLLQMFADAHAAVFLSLPLVLFLRMALNAIDGMLAREHGMKSPLGAILNELGDVISDTVLYLPFALLPGVYGWLVVLLVITAILSEMTGVIALQIGASRRYDGPMGKSDRAFVFGAAGLALGFDIKPDTWLNGVIALMLALTLFTIINRARQALKEIA